MCGFAKTSKAIETPVASTKLDEVRNQLRLNQKWQERALVVLFDRQTATEQSIAETHEHNGRGFNARDARFGTSLARQIMQGRHLSRAQATACSRMLPKYARQILEAIRDKAVKVLQVAPPIETTAGSWSFQGPFNEDAYWSSAAGEYERTQELLQIAAEHNA